MYTQQPKKLLIISILDILNKYTNADNRLSAKEILDILEKDYGLKVDRKAVKRNLMDLVDFGYDIEYSETVRKKKNGEDEIIYSDWYINHKFEESELRLLIDSLLFSKHIPYSQCKDLIKKLTELSSVHFQANVKHIQNLPENLPRNPEILYTIEVLNEAISKKKQVSFNYTLYDINKKKYKKLNDKGNPLDYVINPYQMIGTNGRYYLICNLDKYEDLVNYRIDRISNIKMLDEKIKPLKQLKGYANGLDLPKHMAEHIYMFAGDTVPVKFRAYLPSYPTIFTDLVDWFGFDFEAEQVDDDNVDVTVRMNEKAMFFWALQYGTPIEVLSPKSLRDSIAKATKDMSAKYNS